MDMYPMVVGKCGFVWRVNVKLLLTHSARRTDQGTPIEALDTSQVAVTTRVFGRL